MWGAIRFSSAHIRDKNQQGTHWTGAHDYVQHFPSRSSVAVVVVVVVVVAKQVSWSLSLPPGTYTIVTTPDEATGGSTAGTIDMCAGTTAGIVPVSYRVRDSSTRNFWDDVPVTISGGGAVRDELG